MSKKIDLGSELLQFILVYSSLVELFTPRLYQVGFWTERATTDLESNE